MNPDQTAPREQPNPGSYCLLLRLPTRSSMAHWKSVVRLKISRLTRGVVLCPWDKTLHPLLSFGSTLGDKKSFQHD